MRPLKKKSQSRSTLYCKILHCKKSILVKYLTIVELANKYIINYICTGKYLGITNTGAIIIKTRLLVVLPNNLFWNKKSTKYGAHMNANAVTQATARSPVLSFISHTSRVT